MVIRALVLCVSPPVSGLPLPNFPVNVRVNVSGAAPLSTFTRTVTGYVPLNKTELGTRVQVVAKYCGSLHVNDTVPVNPPKEVRVRINLDVVVVAGETLSLVGATEIEKSTTAARPFVRLPTLGLKFQSPE
jgi:LysM repeat protein